MSEGPERSVGLRFPRDVRGLNYLRGIRRLGFVEAEGSEVPEGCDGSEGLRRLRIEGV